MVVFVSSCLIVVYLAAALCVCSAGETERSAAGEAREPSEEAASPGAPAAGQDEGSASWVREGKPVPDWALYRFEHGESAPVPSGALKEPKWYEKVLFPTVRCPYCGRSVPTWTGSYVFLIIGFVGQIAFSGRFLVQWLASEKARASVIPVGFWWLSIVGSVLLLAYAVSILAWPIILGQAPNIFIYSRNLYFIGKGKGTEAFSRGGGKI